MYVAQVVFMLVADTAAGSQSAPVGCTWMGSHASDRRDQVTVTYDSAPPCCVVMNSFLVDPVMLSGLPALDLAFAEPQSNLFLGTLNTIGTVADVATNINGIVTSDGTRGGRKRICGTENG